MSHVPGTARDGGRRRAGLIVTRILKAFLCAGIAASWVTAEYARSHWLPNHSGIPGLVSMLCFGVAGSGLSVAGLQVIRTAAQRQWRQSRGRAFGGTTAIEPYFSGNLAMQMPAAGHDERLEEIEARLGVAEKKSTDTFALMKLVCDELAVDTGTIDETRPLLRIIDGGQAG